MTDTRTMVPDAGHLVALWTGVLLAPTAFLLNLELGYLAVPATCTGGTAQLLHLIHGACLLVAIAGGGHRLANLARDRCRLAGRNGRARRAEPIPGGAGTQRERALRSDDRRAVDPDIGAPPLPVMISSPLQR